MKKFVSICKLRTILEVARSRKIRCLREKTLSIQARFSVKNRAKIGPESDSERKRQEKTTKTVSGAVSGRTFLSPGSFSVHFGVRPGAPNPVKTGPGTKKCARRRRRKRFLSFFLAVAVRSRSPDRFLEGPTLENPIIS